MNAMVKRDKKTIAQLDPISRALLPVIRYFYLSFREPSLHSWRLGFDCAIGTWGQDRGLVIANATQKFIYDLHRCRKSALHFCDPLDIDMRDTVAPDEKTVLRLLIFMRKDQTRKARNIISILHQGRIDPVFVRHGLELAATLDGEPTRAKSPKLKVVK